MITTNQSQKRLEIIEVAAQEFAEKGFQTANINEIATKSGIGKGTIYLYFNTKKELYLATIQALVDQFNELSERLISMEISSSEKLALIIESFFELERERLPFLKLWARHQFHHDPVFPEEVSEIFNGLRQPLCEIIEQGVEKGVFFTSHPHVTGYIVLSMLVMLMPSLQLPNMVLFEREEERIPYVMELVNKVLHS
jgi:TetR/AcrR family fatty acid metabolism transcriptional regulator